MADGSAPPQDLRRRVKNLAKRMMWRGHLLASRAGVHVTPVHFYSCMPDVPTLERTRETWAKRSEMPGITVDPDAQAASLRRMCLPYQAEYAGNAAYREGVARHFGPGYGPIEAQALHGVVRSLRPRRIIEVGSGVSTHCMLAAAARNREDSGSAPAITCIEPYPSEALRRAHAAGEVTLIPSPVQTTPLEAFAPLGENDLLFIDSSHTVRPGSDVNYLYLEVLPRLAPGVVVHIHDIYFPYDYSRSVLKTMLHWSEVSLLRAFLTHNSRAEILFCLSQLHYDRPEALKEVFPEYQPQAGEDGLEPPGPAFEPVPGHFPSSIYIKIL